MKGEVGVSLNSAPSLDDLPFQQGRAGTAVSGRIGITVSLSVIIFLQLILKYGDDTGFAFRVVTKSTFKDIYSYEKAIILHVFSN